MTTPIGTTDAPPGPSVHVEARFADWSAVIGLWVMALQWSIVQLLVVGLGIASCTGSLDSPIGTAEVLTWLAMAAAVAWFGYYIWQFSRRCRVVRVASDGTWILRNCIGLEIGRIAPTTPRQLTSYSQKVRSHGVSNRKWTRSYAEIAVAGRTWQTCRSIPAMTSRAMAQLQGTPAA